MGGEEPDGLTFAYASASAARAFGADPGALSPGRLPEGVQPVARNGSWLLGGRC